jgi:hypothetical protein
LARAGWFIASARNLPSPLCVKGRAATVLRQNEIVKLLHVELWAKGLFRGLANFRKPAVSASFNVAGKSRITRRSAVIAAKDPKSSGSYLRSSNRGVENTPIPPAASPPDSPRLPAAPEDNSPASPPLPAPATSPHTSPDPPYSHRKAATKSAS